MNAKPLRAVAGFVRVPHQILNHAIEHRWTARHWRVYIGLVQRCDRVTWTITARQLGTVAGISAGNVRAALADLLRQDVVQRQQRNGNSGSPFRFKWLDYKADADSESDVNEAAGDELGETSQGASNSKHQGASNSKRKGASNSKHPGAPYYSLSRSGQEGRRPSCLPDHSDPEDGAGRQVEFSLSERAWRAFGDAFPPGVYPRDRWARALAVLSERAELAQLRRPTLRELLGYFTAAGRDASLMRPTVRDPLSVACTDARWLSYWTPRARRAASTATA